jgi:hypothetical protein
MHSDDARDVLLWLLAAWPRSGDSVDVAFVKLARKLDPGFDKSDLANIPPRGFDRVSRELRVGDMAKFVVSEGADSESLSLAVLRQDPSGAWKLVSFKFQCASCFGSGVLDGEPCDTCGASGWGLGDGQLI